MGSSGGRTPTPPGGVALTRAYPRTVVVVAWCLAAAYAGWASGTSPFSVPADVAVSIPSALFVAAVFLERRWPDGPWRRLPRERPARGGSALPWAAVFAVLVGSELASYFHGGPRADYPTISSAQVALFHWRAARAVAWLVWLGAGWFLARR